MTLDELITALEQAEGPSRDLDFQIWAHVAGLNLDECRSVFPNFQDWIVTTIFTASIDAAKTLVPDDCLMLLRDLWFQEGKAPQAVLNRYTANEEGRRWLEQFSGLGCNDATSICIAAMKARRAAA